MLKIVAAKLVLQGIADSKIKRDGKTIEEVITSLKDKAKTCDVPLSELTEVSKMRLVDLV